jgi:Cytochrome P450
LVPIHTASPMTASPIKLYELNHECPLNRKIAPRLLCACVAQTQLGGYTIPAGSGIVMSTAWLGRDPEQWTRPDVFLPERHLTPSYDGEPIVCTTFSARIRARRMYAASAAAIALKCAYNATDAPCPHCIGCTHAKQ